MSQLNGLKQEKKRDLMTLFDRDYTTTKKLKRSGRFYIILDFDFDSFFFSRTFL